MEDEEAYKVREVTPKEMQCGVYACPTIYQVVSDCGWGSCPAVYQDKGDYLIISKIVEPIKASLPDGTSLESKVGKGEALIKVPRELIDKLPREQV